MRKITRREFHLGTGVALAGISALAAGTATAASRKFVVERQEDRTLSRIVFGSCCHQDKPQPIWKAILKRHPELFIFLGDNIYGDTRNMRILKEEYDKQEPNFLPIRRESEVIAIWDDHDFGENDIGKEYPFKDQSKELFFEFWNVPKNSPRRRKGDGIYTSYLYGPEESRVHIILPDLRYNRDALRSVDSRKKFQQKDLAGQGPYLPITNKTSTMLGEAQWVWLEQQLQIPSKIKIIGSSVQYIARRSGWEGWANFPHERQRLINLINKYRVNGVIFISGDTHWSELSCQKDNAPYPLWDLTSSGLTQTWDNVSPNIYRWNDVSYVGQNFGAVYIDWEPKDPLIILEVRDVKGNRAFQHTILLSSLVGTW